MSKEITLKEFNVEKQWYGKNEGQYECKASFSHGKNNFTIYLPPSLGEALVAVCRGKIAEASAEALEALTLIAKEEVEE